MATSPDLGLPFVAAQQATPEVTHNEALVMLQALLTAVIDVGRNSPPGAPTEGDAYVIGAAPTGAWAGRANAITVYTSGGWRYIPDRDSTGAVIAMGARHKGMSVYVRNGAGSPTQMVRVIWTGSAWQEVEAFRI